MEERYAALGQLITDAPGRNTGRAALTVLRSLASAGHEDAARVLAGAMARELGVDPGHPLPSLYASLFAPARLLESPPPPKELARPAADEAAFTAFQSLVRRSSPVAVEVLRAYVLASLLTFAEMAATWGGPVLGGGRRMALLDQIRDGVRIVPGDAVDHSFEFGRDFLLARADVHSLTTVIGHEIGHHLFDAAVSGAGAPALELTSGLLTRLAEKLPNAVAAAGTTHDVFGENDPRRLLVGGLSLLVSQPAQPGGEYLHFSLSESGEPIRRATAFAVARWVVEALNADPGQTAVALSPRGIFHLGVATSAVGTASADVPDPDPAALAQRAEQWHHELVAAEREGLLDVDIAPLLGLAPTPVRLVAVHEGALQDHEVSDAILRASAQELADPALAAALVAAAVRCGNPEAADVLRAQSRDTQPDLSQLGVSACVLLAGRMSEVRAADAARLWRTVEVLGEAGVSLDRPVTDDGRTLLTDAAARSDRHVSRLLAAGVDPDVVDAAGETALIVAARSGRQSALEALLAASADVTGADGDGLTVLHHAAWSGLDLEPLLSRGASVAARAGDGRTPLMLARSEMTARELLLSGSELEASDNAGLTALVHAAQRCDLEVVEALLEAGADVHAATDQGFTALHHAAHAPARYGACAVVRALLGAGADVDEEADDGTTPLMLAAQQEEPQVVECLLEAGADADASDRRGITVLMIAAQGRAHKARFDFADGAESVVERLLEAGADVNATDDEGRTVLAQVRERGDAARVQQLTAAVARDPR